MVFLGLMGFVLDRAFQRSAEQAVQEKLLIHIYGLLAVSDENDGELFLPDELQQPQFNSLGSGLYGLVMAAEGQELWQSRSALDLQLGPDHKVDIHANLDPGKPRFGRLYDQPEERSGESLFYLSYKILWQGAADQTTTYVYTVLENMKPYNKEVAGFRNSLWGWLLAVVLVLVLVQAAVMSWGWKPLHTLAQDLKAIEDGRPQYLPGE